MLMKNNYGYLDNQCVCCGETTANDEWSDKEKQLCINCKTDEDE